MFDKITQQITKKPFHLFIIGLLCILVYLPNLNHEFVYDDQSFFIDWTTPRSFSNIAQFFANDLPEGHEHVYRPIRTIFYAIDYLIFKDTPIGYHLQGLLVNVILAYLVYFITGEITKNSYTAFATGLLFGLHPVHTEAITFTTASMDSLGFVMAFGSFYLFMTTKKLSSWKMLFSFFLALLSFLTYEMTLVLPLLMLVYFWIFRPKHLKLREKVLILLPFFLGIFIYAGLRLSLGYISSIATPQSSKQYIFMLITTAKIFYQYLTIVLFPFPLTLDHNITQQLSSLRVLTLTPEFTSQPIIDIHTLISLVSTMLLGIIGFVCMKKKQIITFGILWFYISLLTVVNIIPGGSLFAERYVFLSSFGYCLILGFLLTQKFKAKPVILSSLLTLQPYVLIVVILFYAFLTFVRNNDWKNSLSLWTSTVKVSPYSASGWNNLGIVYSDMKKDTIALSYYRKALQIDPHQAFAYSNIGLIYYQKGQYDTAIRLFKTALRYNPNDLNELKYIALAQSKQLTKQQEGIIMIATHKQTEDKYISQERQLIVQGEIDQALVVLGKAIKDYPSNTTFLNDVAALYNSKGDTKKATDYLNKAIKLDPADPSLYFNLASLLESEGENSDALQTFKFVLKLNPHFQQAKEAITQLQEKGYH